MEQRPLRLGDQVDDYCTRERRVTNHVIVVVAEDAIRQTRCTTCDAEHPYKGAKEPRLRKKPGATLYEQVLSGVTGASDGSHPSTGSADSSVSVSPVAASAADADAVTNLDTVGEDAESAVRPEDGWLAHRTLIRASLPKTDEPPAPRPIPEFTMYQRPQPRGRNFRFGGGPSRPHSHSNGSGGEANGNVNGNGNGNGNRSHGGFDGRPGPPSGGQPAGGRPGRRRRRRSR